MLTIDHSRGYSSAFGAVVAGEVMKALRAGMSLELVIGTLQAQVDVLKVSQPIAQAVAEARGR